MVRAPMSSYFQILVCPNCNRNLIEAGDGLSCAQCNSVFGPNRHGYLEFVADEAPVERMAEYEEYASIQESSGARRYYEYLKPLVCKEPCRRILDVGCGIGKAVSLLLDDGYEAYGIDLPMLSRFWALVGRDAQHFLCCDATRLPFRDDFFDVVWSLGVIEHIGTVIGHCTLSEDYWEVRRSYAKEILRVTRPGGRIMIDCPNKSFPIDICHGPIDDLTPKNTVNALRTYISKLTGINIHPITRKYHLLSYAETKKLFCDEGGAISFEPLPLKGYFSFGMFESGFLKPFAKLAKIYVNNLPRPLRPTPLNPYMSVLIRK